MQALLSRITRWLATESVDVETAVGVPGLHFQVNLTHAHIRVSVVPVRGVLHLTAHLPVRASLRRRTATAEFLHRLNLTLHHLQWMFDPDDGGILCRQNIDLDDRPLDEARFRGCLERLVFGVDGTLPALLGVVGGGLSPATAVDQAQAELEALLRSCAEERDRTDARLGLHPPRDSDPTRN